MYNIAILGCENSHAQGFLDLICNGEFTQLNVVGVYSDEIESAKKLHEEFGVNILKNYDDACGKVDGILVTARHGDNHLKYIKPYIKYSIPMFVDKPITKSTQDAEELVKLAKKHNIRMCGGSSVPQNHFCQEMKSFAENNKDVVLGGHIIAPIVLDSPYGGFSFYAQHLIEMMLSVFGYDVQYVTAVKHEKSVYVIAEYDKFAVTLNFSGASYYYHISVATTENCVSQNVVTQGQNPFKTELEELVELMGGEKMKKTYEDFVKPVYVINAIEKAMNTEKKVKVKGLEL